MREQRRGGKIAMGVEERDAFLASERTCRVNAISDIVAAAPGIVTYTDLPLTLPRGWVPQVPE